MTTTQPRLKALRRSHCDTCGCDRCKWIDAALTGLDDPVHLPDEDDSWLVEGILSVDEKGTLMLYHEGQTISLEEALAKRIGHHVLVLVGAAKEQTSIQ